MSFAARTKLDSSSPRKPTVKTAMIWVQLRSGNNFMFMFCMYDTIKMMGLLNDLLSIATWSNINCVYNVKDR